MKELNNKEINTLYNKIGEAVWHLQYVENSLVMLIMIKGVIIEPHSMDEKAANEKATSLYERTIGRLLKKIENLSIIEPNFLERLKQFNEERNWIIHNSVLESCDKILSEDCLIQFFKRCDIFIENAKSIHLEITELLFNHVVSKGIPEDKIVTAVKIQLHKLGYDMK